MLVWTICSLFKVNQEFHYLSEYFNDAGAVCKISNRWYFTILQWNQLSKG